MTIAIITPAYNAALTLDAALESVAGQTLAPDEIVIADDGSADDTIAVARRWSSSLPVRVVSTPANLGPSGARATAIAASSADLLALLDADDVMLPDHLAAMLAAYQATGDGLASADVLNWIPDYGTSDAPLSAASPLPPAAQQLLWLLRANGLSIASLFSRARYDAVGGFRPQFRGTEDWDLWIRMVRAGAMVARPDHPTLWYRLSAGNVSSEARLVDARLAVLEAAAREGGADEQAVIRLARRQTEAAGHLFDAYAQVADGHAFTARLAGARAVRGIRPVAVRGLAMAVAPRTTLRRREAVRYRPDVWMNRYRAR